jgi:hypothetical protein
MLTMMLINGFSNLIVLAVLATSFALDMLANFCIIDKIYEQSIIALVVVIMLLAYAYRQAVLILKCGLLINIGLMGSYRLSFSVLSLYLDNYITLSCYPKGINSLLCSVFFNLGVSYNLIGAQKIGVMEALLLI